jgi:cell division protein FtsW
MPDFQENFEGDGRTEGKIDWSIGHMTWSSSNLMVYSASAHLAARRYHNSFYFAQKQLGFAFFGFMVMICFRFVPYQRFQKWVYWLLGASLLTLILVLIPGIGSRMGGASCWFRLRHCLFRGISKLVLVIFFSGPCPDTGSNP